MQVKKKEMGEKANVKIQLFSTRSCQDWVLYFLLLNNHFEIKWTDT